MNRRFFGNESKINVKWPLFIHLELNTVTLNQFFAMALCGERYLFSLRDFQTHQSFTM